MPPTATIRSATGFATLKDLCALPTDSTAFRSLQGADPVTSRVAFIRERLAAEGIPAELDRFQPVEGVPDAEPGRPALANLTVTFPGVDPSVTTVFLAHHDVVDPDSENCQDNSASVANLMDLCSRLAQRKPRHTVVVAFTDGEELGRPWRSGAQRLARHILEGRHGAVQYAVNLDLTAGGTETTYGCRRDHALTAAVQHLHPGMHRLDIPFNDAVVLESAGIPCACFGLLTPAELDQARQRGFCSTWALCHRREDTFAASAVEADMTRLVDDLETLI